MADVAAAAELLGPPMADNGKHAEMAWFRNFLRDDAGGEAVGAIVFSPMLPVAFFKVSARVGGVVVACCFVLEAAMRCLKSKSPRGLRFPGGKKQDEDDAISVAATVPAIDTDANADAGGVECVSLALGRFVVSFAVGMLLSCVLQYRFLIQQCIL